MISKKKSLNNSLFLFVFLLFGAVVVWLNLNPEMILNWTKTFNINLKSPQRAIPIFINRINNYMLLFFLGGIFIYFRHRVKSIILKIYYLILNIIASISISKLLGILLIVQIIIVFWTGILNYDLGFDEAWYTKYAKTFSENFIPHTTFNEQISYVDMISMIPYYITYSGYKLIKEISLMDIKIMGASLSLIGLVLLGYSTYSVNRNIKLLFLFLFFIVIQPGFGFVSTSFFGEILGIGLIFMGFKNLINDGKRFWGIFLIALAINTKFQLFPLVIFTFIIFGYLYRDKALIYHTCFLLIFMFVIFVVRFSPIWLFNRDIIPYYFKFAFSYYLGYHQAMDFWLITDKLQLYNKFFPLIIIILTTIWGTQHLRNKFDVSIFIFGFVATIYLIFLNNVSTYRLFIFSIIPVLYISTLLIYQFYKEQYRSSFTKFQKFIVVILVFISFLYGITTNYKYARIGYNDGVQFDLDGFKGRLFTPIEHDSSQKLFYESLKNIISDDDIIFTPSPYLTNFYLSNKVYDLSQIFNSDIKGNNYYAIISRESYPNEILKGYGELKKVVKNFEEYLIIGDFHLLTIKKENLHLKKSSEIYNSNE